jgi:hypothetical protein
MDPSFELRCSFIDQRRRRFDITTDTMNVQALHTNVARALARSGIKLAQLVLLPLLMSVPLKLKSGGHECGTETAVPVGRKRAD